MRPPRAEVFAVGTELLLHGRKDTNSAELSSLLSGMGFEVRRRLTLGDDLDELQAAFQDASRRCDLLLATGGLGPTADDRTRDALAAAFARELVEDAEIRHGIEARFRRRDKAMPHSNRRQALVPRGAEALPNPEGTAPGIWLSHAGGIVILLPGPPVEMRAVLSGAVRERIRRTLNPPPTARRCVITAGLGESDLEDRLGDLYELRPEVTLTVLASPGLVEVLILARHQDSAMAEEAASEVAEEAERRLRRWIFATRETTLASHVGELLRQRGECIAVAESCTGGLLGGELTRAPGSSEFFLGGVLAYSNSVKQALLGVPASILETHGAVSEPTAGAMAQGVRERLGADHGVAVTGIAGPGGGTKEKPVGTVCLAVAGAEGTASRLRRFHGGRDRVREWSVAGALHLLREQLCGNLQP